MDGIQPTLNLGNDGGCWGGGAGALWIVAIFLLLCGGNFLGGRGGNAASTEDVNNSANFTRLESQVNANGAAIDRSKDTIGNGICNLGFEFAKQSGHTENLIIERTGQLSKEILEGRYATEKTILQQACEIKNLLQQNRIDALTEQVRQLQIANATAGMVRYPMQMSFTPADNPFVSKTGTTTTA